MPTEEEERKAKAERAKKLVSSCLTSNIPRAQGLEVIKGEYSPRAARKEKRKIKGRCGSYSYSFGDSYAYALCRAFVACFD